MLFKPTKSTKNPFRPTGEEAMSYFVGAEAMNNDEFKGEDAALQPYTLTLIPCPEPETLSRALAPTLALTLTR